MILRIRNSRTGKSVSLLMAGLMLFSIINPQGLFALTGGPSQPEFNAFTPIGTSDMVDLSSGDFSYNIPLADIGGFPINLAYGSGITMDQEASWVGLGFNLSIGQINRQMRGLPDDFNNEAVQYENNVKDNYTVGASLTGNPALFGVDGSGLLETIGLTLGISGQYNSYNGVSITPSAGLSFDVSENCSVGLNIKSDENGLTLSPNASLHAKYKTSHQRDNSLGASVGLSFNSRQGLSSVNMSSSRSTVSKTSVKAAGTNKFKQSGSIGSSVSFVDNTYTPTIRDGLTSVNFTFNAALGSEFFGGEAQGQIAGFGSNQYIMESDKDKVERGYGYEFTRMGNDESVLDFNREKDGNVSVNTTHLPVTNYTYDLYSVQGQGVGGMFRPYHSQIGYVHDNRRVNYGGGGSLGIELGAGNAVHNGLDIEVTVSHGESGPWIDGNDAESAFDEDGTADPLYESVYFKNVGDLSVDNDWTVNSGGLNYMGGLSPSRLKISGDEFNRTLEDAYETKSSAAPGAYSTTSGLSDADFKRTERLKRNQNILKISVEEATDAIENEVPLIGFEEGNIDPPAGVGESQTAGFIITRNDGARYVYGKPLYNTLKREVSFATGDEVGGGPILTSGLTGNSVSGLVIYSPGVDNSLDNDRGDHYFNRVTTPAYAHTYLLSTLASTDYSDIDEVEGASAGDLGSYTKFTYNDRGTYKWRVPYLENSANYNEGIKTDPTDDKGSYVYGEKELQYIQKIETKTHVALFYISPRNDAHGVVGENGGKDNGQDMYKLDRIAIYSVGELEEDGTDSYGNITPTSTSIPIKEIHFEYDYSLCQGIPNNDEAYFDGDGDAVNDNFGGKLTLRKVYFTYRNSNMGKYSSYDFTYGDSDHDGTEDSERNPDYNLKAYDIWGCYKSNTEAGINDSYGNLSQPSVPEFNSVDQNDENINDNTAAWSLSDIALPSGGIIKIDYESDDYNYVQNKKVMQMFEVVGAGVESDPTVSGAVSTFEPLDLDSGDPKIDQSDDEALLYKVGSSQDEAEYLYIRLDDADQGLPEGTNNMIFDQKYLGDIWNKQDGLIQFRFYMNMDHEGGKNSNWEDGNFDYVTGYFKLDLSKDRKIFEDGPSGEEVKYASIPVKLVDIEDGDDEDTNPISKAGWHYGRKYLSRYIYGFPELDDAMAPNAMVNTIINSIDGLMEVFLGANGLLRNKEVARRFIPEKSWIRLGCPSGAKKGGGCRVAQVVMTDAWGEMTKNEYGGTPNSAREQYYGQEYSYDVDLADGSVISSGVASYEPVGCKENPFVQPVFSSTEHLLSPDEENYVERPFGESFFPSPTVTYSRVEVKNIERFDDLGDEVAGNDIAVQKHATGRVVTEFFTSKDYPTIVDETELDLRQDDPGILTNLLNINVKKHMTLTQGYVVHLNDMNGKMKSQRVYAEDQDQFISGVDYIYDGVAAADPSTMVSSTAGRLENNVQVLTPDGDLTTKKIGVEIDVINDFRKMSSETEIVGVNGNLATFLVGTFPGMVPVPLPDYAHHEDELKMSVTTKVINSFGILRETVAHDAGASVATRNLLWDEATGEVLLTETVNEYGDKYYSLNYPAHWAYSGMGMACENAGVEVSITGTGSSFSLSGADQYFHNGDEVLIDEGEDGDYDSRAWLDEVTTSGFKLLNEDGANITFGGSANSIKVIRSGRRNIQSTSMASITLMKNPLDFISGTISSGFLASSDPANWNVHKIVNAGAVEFSDAWFSQCECGDSPSEVVNSYRMNTEGVWRALRSHLYLTGRHHNKDLPGTSDDATASAVSADDASDPRNDGFFVTFSPFYKFNGTNWYVDNAGWTYTSEVTQFSAHGFELENADALLRYSAALYGFNNSFPLAVGANTTYENIGYDGFEDYGFEGCDEGAHFDFRDIEGIETLLNNQNSHTGKWSLKVDAGNNIIKVFPFSCD